MDLEHRESLLAHRSGGRSDRRGFLWLWLLASMPLAAQTTAPFDPANPARQTFPQTPGAMTSMGPEQVIAIDPLDPRLNADEPWILGPDGRPIPQSRDPRPPTPVFEASLGQAFSVREDEPAIELTFGEQPALGETLGVRISRLEIEPAVIELTVGQSFLLDQLMVKAYSATGEFVEHVPLTLGIEGPEGFVDMPAFGLDGKTLPTLTRGIGRIWVTSVLPALLTDPFSLPVVVIVREPGTGSTGLSNRIYENVPASL